MKSVMIADSIIFQTSTGISKKSWIKHLQPTSKSSSMPDKKLLFKKNYFPGNANTRYPLGNAPSFFE